MSKKDLKLAAGSIISGNQIIVGRSGLDPFKKVPLSLTSVVLLTVAPIYNYGNEYILKPKAILTLT